MSFYCKVLYQNGILKCQPFGTNLHIKYHQKDTGSSISAIAKCHSSICVGMGRKLVLVFVAQLWSILSWYWVTLFQAEIRAWDIWQTLEVAGENRSAIRHAYQTSDWHYSSCHVWCRLDVPSSQTRLITWKHLPRRIPCISVSGAQNGLVWL